MSMLSMSAGFRANNGFVAASALLVRASMLKATPSITNKGWLRLPDNGEVSPRILMRMGAPGRPEF